MCPECFECRAASGSYEDIAGRSGAAVGARLREEGMSLASRLRSKKRREEVKERPQFRRSESGRNNAQLSRARKRSVKERTSLTACLQTPEDSWLEFDASDKSSIVRHLRNDRVCFQDSHHLFTF